MKQIIVSADSIANDDAVGGVTLQVLNANGVWTAWSAAVSGDPLLRISRKGDADNIEVSSPPFKSSAVIGCEAFAATASSAQINTVALTEASGAGVADGLALTFKVIETSSGYEPFNRVSVTVNCGADASATAALIRAAIAAKVAVPGSVASKIIAVSGSGANIIITGADATKRFEVAMESPEVDGVTCYTAANTKSAAVAGIGVGAEVKAEEILQQGREYSGYDRLVAYKTFEDQTFAVSGKMYHLFSLTVANDAPGQIRGVDNRREILIYLPEDAVAADGSTATDHYDLKDATNGTGLHLALVGQGFMAANYLDD